ncbi:MAG: SprT protein [Bacteroidales bacterium]|jgi:hypothetical protein|nr:SprT protein [Bacteroidales bacterium]MDN5330041.1 SprT protein [Bacteroidales bacterium]NLH53634.1 hypothetical protein [Bacteroidales bacterium]NPV35552.1 hypothetical protein [Bacteroidales bacterium]
MKNLVLRDREAIIRGLTPYLPPGVAPMVTDLILALPNLDLKIVEPRTRRRGDYQFKREVSRHQITINWDLSRHNFLITFLHEYAHLIAVQKYGNSIAPHGKEWKKEYRNVALPFVLSGKLHPVFTAAFKHYLVNPYASSERDTALMDACRRADAEIKQVNW